MSCSSDEQSDKECPLCMEPLEIDDVDFYPCKCEYQICRFCWHRLRTDENGLCPACRQPYPEDPVNFKPLSTADLQKIKSEKKLKAQAERQRVSESRKHLANYRVLQKNLVYVVGLSQRVADMDVLKKHEFFGKFGKIVKVVVGTTTNAPPQLVSSHTAYVTYAKVEEALRAIQGVNNATLDGRLVRASLGTTKYCSSFLRSQQCYKQECMYLHDIADNDISFTKEDMHQGKHTDYERRLIEQVLLRAPQQSFTPVATVTPTVRAPMHAARPSSSDERTTPSGKRDTSSDKENDESIDRIRDEELRPEMQREHEEKERAQEEERQRIEDEERIAAEELDHLEHELAEAEDKKRLKMKEEDQLRDSQLSDSMRMPLSEHSVLSNDGFMNGFGTAPDSSTSLLHSWSKGSNENDSPINAPAPVTSWQALLGLAPAEPTSVRSCSPFGTLNSSSSSSNPFGGLINGLQMDAAITGPLFQGALSAASPASNLTTTARAPSPPPGLGMLPRSAALSPSSCNGLTSTFTRSTAAPSPPPGLTGFMSDDDLGFDPFSESSKGLADLLEEEKRYQPTVFTPAPVAQGQGAHLPFELGPFNNQAATAQLAQQNYLAGIQAQLMAQAAQQQRDKERMEREQHEQWVRNMQQHSQMPPTTLNYQTQHMGMNSQHHSTSSLFGGLGSSIGSSSQHSLHNSKMHHAQSNDIFGPIPRMDSASVIAPPPGLASNMRTPSHSSHSIHHSHSMQQNNHHMPQAAHQAPSLHGPAAPQKSSLTEWQEGLKALLPNVNIRFAPDLDQVGAGSGARSAGSSAASANNACGPFSSVRHWARWAHSQQSGAHQLASNLPHGGHLQHQPQLPVHHGHGGHHLQHNHLAQQSNNHHVSPASLFSETNRPRILTHIPPPPGFTVPAGGIDR